MNKLKTKILALLLSVVGLNSVPCIAMRGVCDLARLMTKASSRKPRINADDLKKRIFKDIDTKDLEEYISSENVQKSPAFASVLVTKTPTNFDVSGTQSSLLKPVKSTFSLKVVDVSDFIASKREGISGERKKPLLNLRNGRPMLTFNNLWLSGLNVISNEDKNKIIQDWLESRNKD